MDGSIRLSAEERKRSVQVYRGSRKRLANLLSVTVQRHETLFGVLETDIAKRIRDAGAT